MRLVDKLHHPVWRVILTAGLTAIAGEFKWTPFHEEGFRFGLGVSVFFLSFLLLPKKVYIKTGVVTGLFVVLFRIGEEYWEKGKGFSLLLSLDHNFPAMIYYLVYSLLLRSLPLEKYRFFSLRLGAIGTAVDFLSNSVEHTIRVMIYDRALFIPMDYTYFFLVAVLRSYFVVGVYSGISIQQFRVIHQEQKKRLEQMMKVSSGLFAETLYLQKSMENIEQITARGYELFRRLKDEGNQGLSRKALGIAQQIHEVKKDSQRILAGLRKLFDQELVADMRLSETVGFVIGSSQKYAEMLNRKVSWEVNQTVDYMTSSYIPLLTVLGNLISNAVEAISAGEDGLIRVSVWEKGEETVLAVEDNGIGISEPDYEIIFEPGYTTKFNDDGAASTGIGLSHVLDIVQTLQGEMNVASSSGITRFTIRIPTIQLKVKDK